MPDHAAWIEAYVRDHGRRPRVLHIGNIANNAYLNAKFLNAAGLDCDVLCYNYYHIMGCPEWEDSDFNGEVGNHFAPQWHKVDLRGFRRPRWFAQGPRWLCLKYLVARRTGHNTRAGILWHLVAAISRLRSVFRLVGGPLRLAVRLWQDHKSQFSSLYWWMRAWRHPLGAAALLAFGILLVPVSLLAVAVSLVLLAVSCLVWASRPAWLLVQRMFSDPPLPGASEEYRFETRSEELLKLFHARFPSRAPLLSTAYMGQWEKPCKALRRLFLSYDIIQGYATDPIFPLLAGKRPFVAFEHGTIRHIPFEEDGVGQLTALAYREADAVVITNCDNIEAARKLGLDNHRFIPHPVNELPVGDEAEVEGLRRSIAQRLGADFLVFHPSRQHWGPERHPDWEKGNDILVRGLARFVKEVRPRAGAVFVRWGQRVAESEALLREQGIADRVLWIEPQPGIRMTRYIRACDLVADQFHLGAFGSTLPKALACGRACMIYLNEEVHHWCFPELPPVLNARTPEEVFRQLSRFSADAEYRRDLEERGVSWYRRYHSAEVIVNRHLEMYREVLERRSPPPPVDAASANRGAVRV